MARKWSERAIADQRDYNRMVVALQQQNEQLPGADRSPIATMVRTVSEIPPGTGAECVFLGGRPGNLQPSGGGRVMYNLASENVIAARQDCLAMPCHLPGFGNDEDGLWVIVRVLQGSSGEVDQGIKCDAVDGGTLNQVRISVSGLVDVVASPEFDGWAKIVNDRSPIVLRHEEGFIGCIDDPGIDVCLGPTVSISPCQPGIEIQVPQNGVTGRRNGPFVVKLQLIHRVGRESIIRLVFNAGSVGDLAFFQFENTVSFSENPLNKFPRASSGLAQVNGANYSDWQAPSNAITADDSEPFRDWLDNGTWTLNPT